MAPTLQADVELSTIDGDSRPVEDWVTTFHLVLVALDPYTYESSWLLDTAGRVLTAFTGADCRVGWLVTAEPADAKSFLGPWGEQLLTFADPDRTVVRALGLETMPALVHIDHALEIVGRAEGWNPAQWREVTTHLADLMSWTRPALPGPGDPTPYPGVPI